MHPFDFEKHFYLLLKDFNLLMCDDNKVVIAVTLI